MIPFLNPQRIYRPKRTIKEMVKDAGLLASLALCLDPGDKNSWTGNGQTLFDVSGNGRDFTLGSSNSISTDDPTFNGVSGRESAREYFSSDGGDGFQKAGANDSFFDSLHKSGWNWTAITMELFTSSYGAGFVTRTRALSANNDIGVSTFISSNQPNFRLGNGSNALGTALITTGSPMLANTMLMTAVGMKYNSDTNRDFVGYVNGTYQFQNFTSPSFTPSTSAASTQVKLGMTSDGSSFLGSGRQIHGFLMFDKMLSQAEFDALRSSFQRRWPTV
ncbi:hypothetical protein [Mesorhizobium humile]|uniref:LamG domain-containing protein n=1 Tax=Mesorhizobium humile TaxID=3072313 RepID=A0ABU4YTV4_9HYPH|nr:MULTISPECIES: hypothetical protein [unclassified Mesorhizobium]MDX8462964.1 hypothetical protein [Mesorhizobium sp. VK2D]MDX8489324.1 hypothetical protein [Mesorhizobium sp. VK2B]